MASSILRAQDGNILLIGTGVWEHATNEETTRLTLTLFDHNLGFLDETLIEIPQTLVNEVIVLADNKILVAGEPAGYNNGSNGLAFEKR